MPENQNDAKHSSKLHIGYREILKINLKNSFNLLLRTFVTLYGSYPSLNFLDFPDLSDSETDDDMIQPNSLEERRPESPVLDATRKRPKRRYLTSTLLIIYLLFIQF